MISLTLLALLPLSSGDSDLATHRDDSVAAITLEATELETPAAAGSSLPNLAQGQDGKVYLSWMEPRDEGGNALRFSVFQEEHWGPARDIASGTDFFVNWADFPSMAVSSGGALVAHWLRRDGTPHGYNAEFSVSTDGGATWSPPRLLHTDRSSAEHGFVSIAPLGEKTFGAIWLDGRAMADPLAKRKQTGLYFRTISASGDLGEEQLIDERVCDCCQTSLIATEPGQLLAAFRDRDSREVRDIATKTFDGASWSKAKLVHEDGWLIQGCPVNGPALWHGKERQSLLWFTGAGEGGGQVKLASRARGTPGFGFPTRIDDGSPIGRVELAPCGEELLAAWLEHTESSFAEWRVRPVGPSGASGEPLTLATVSAERHSGYLRMAPLGSDCLAVWTSTGKQPGIVSARLRVAP